MGVWQKFMNRFSVYDLIIIAMMSALGIAIKPIIIPLAQIIAGPLLIPTGVVAGGFFMMWLVAGFGLTGKRGTMTLIGIVQAILVMATGIIGTQGVMSLVSYTIPGLLADLGLFLIGHRVCCLPCAFLAGMLSNIAGAAVVNFINYRLPVVPLVLSLSAAGLSGGLGGLVAFKIVQQVWKSKKRDWSTGE